MRCRKDFKTVRNLTVKKALQDFGVKEMYLQESISLVLRASKKAKLSSFSSVYTIPFPKCAGKSSVFKIYRFQKIYRQKVCRFRVNGRPISHTFHRFQNVPAQCKRDLALLRRFEV